MITSDALFAGLPEKPPVARYHSLAADEASLPDCLKVTPKNADGRDHGGQTQRKYPVYGLQFHPESIMTPGRTYHIEKFSFHRMTENDA